VRKTIALLIALFAADWRDFPNRPENESATRLMATAERLGDGRHNDADTIRTLRAEIISNPPPVWAQHVSDIHDPPMPPLGRHMRIFRLLSADATAQHESKNDRAAWADLHAIWILSRALWTRPEAWSINTAATGTRIVIDVAAKLDQPRPAWWSELTTLDVRRPLVRSIEYEVWLMRERAEYLHMIRAIEIVPAIENGDPLPKSDWTPFAQRVLSLQNDRVAERR
jgi:hypothetical protein